VTDLFDGEDYGGSKPVKDRVVGKMTAWDKRMARLYKMTEDEWLEEAKRSHDWVTRFKATRGNPRQAMILRLQQRRTGDGPRAATPE